MVLSRHVSVPFPFAFRCRRHLFTACLLSYFTLSPPFHTVQQGEVNLFRVLPLALTTWTPSYGTCVYRVRCDQDCSVRLAAD